MAILKAVVEKVLIGYNGRCGNREAVSCKWDRRLQFENLERREMFSVAALVPAYFYPTPGGSAWDQLAAAAPKTRVTAILNPDSGPGSAVDANYVAAVNKLQAAGGQVIGYLHTSYGLRSLNTVEAEINEYRNWYHVNGVFVDEMTSDSSATYLQYYQTIYQYAHRLQSNWAVVGNPGMIPTEDYARLPVADVLVTYEDSVGFSSYTAPGWQHNYAASRFANIVYDVQMVSAMQADVNRAVGQGAGWVYVTNGKPDNPYDALPSYWPQFLSALANASPVTRPATPTSLVAKGVSPSQVNLSWNAVAGATGYVINELIGTAWRQIATTTSASYVVPKLNPGTTYSFEVAAYNSAGAGNFTSPQNALTTPAAPANLVARVLSKSQISLSWNPVTSATGYVVEQWIGSAWRPIGTINNGKATSVTVNVSPGTTYYFDVVAFNASGLGAWPNWVSVTTPLR